MKDRKALSKNLVLRLFYFIPWPVSLSKVLRANYVRDFSFYESQVQFMRTILRAYCGFIGMPTTD